jgi:OmpA-OmpF porin, OOP family
VRGTSGWGAGLPASELRRALAVFASATATMLAAACTQPDRSFEACDATSEPTVAAQPTGEPSFLVFFAEDEATVPPSAHATTAEVARKIEAHASMKAILVGHDDTSKGAQAAMDLSLRRAEAIKGALIVLGIPAERIFVSAKGKEQLMELTADGVSEPLNCRVEIFLR